MSKKINLRYWGQT